MVEHNLAKVGVASSNLVSRSNINQVNLVECEVRKGYLFRKSGNSSVVEHNLAKVGVASSNLVSRSNLILVIKLVIKMSISNDHKNQCLALVFLCLKINEARYSTLAI